MSSSHHPPPSIVLLNFHFERENPSICSVKGKQEKRKEQKLAPELTNARRKPRDRI